MARLFFSEIDWLLSVVDRRVASIQIAGQPWNNEEYALLEKMRRELMEALLINVGVKKMNKIVRAIAILCLVVIVFYLVST